MIATLTRPNRTLLAVTLVAPLTLGGLAWGAPPPPGSVFPRPTNLVLLEDGCDQVRLKWQDNSSSEYGFELFQSAAGGPWQKVLTLPANSTQAALSAGSWTGTWCEYKVRAYRFSGHTIQYSSFSNVVAGYRGCPH